MRFDQTAVWHSDAAKGPSTPSLDHLVGPREHHRRDREAERAGGSLEVDRQFVLRSLLHREVRWFCALEDFVDVNGGTTIEIEHVWRIAHETARLHILFVSEHSSKPVRQRKLYQGYGIVRVAGG